jgi:hypothetical protein
MFSRAVELSSGSAQRLALAGAFACTSAPVQLSKARLILALRPGLETPMMRALLALLVCAFAAPLMAQIPVKIYAQELVDRTVAGNRDLLVVAMHVTPPNARENVIIASNIGRIGKAADQDDLRVIETDKPHVEVAHGGERFEVELPLRDVTGVTIGALGLVWPYRSGQDQASFEAKAQRIRDGLAKRILNVANLMDAYPLDPMATTRTHAQKLVEATVARHPEVTVLAIRASSKSAGSLVVLGSTFGRHGKKADADDLKIFDQGDPVTGLYAGGKRFGADLPLLDRAGHKIGTMNVGYAWTVGGDEKTLLAKALALRDELRPSIVAVDDLEELDP